LCGRDQFFFGWLLIEYIPIVITTERQNHKRSFLVEVRLAATVYMLLAFCRCVCISQFLLDVLSPFFTKYEPFEDNWYKYSWEEAPSITLPGQTNCVKEQ